MIFELENNLVFEEIKVIGDKDTAEYYGSGSLKVFATPAMVALMELTALKSVSVLKEKYGFDTVGIEINVKHIKATKINDTVKCISKLVEINGRSLTFEIEVFDSNGKVGLATHKRFIIDPEKFMAKL